jgi:crotonobetainyl-CoA:carnitine CoA-transferase CaiB-like acyl-CoA transferase
VLAPFDSFQAADGWIVIGVGNDRLWRALATLLQLDADSRFDTNENRVAHYDLLRPIVADWCARQPVEQLLDQLHAAGIPSGPIRAIDELAADPDLEARGMLAHVQLAGGGRLTVPGRAVNFSGENLPSYKRGPYLGEHTREILSGRLGLDNAALMALEHSGVIR